MYIQSDHENGIDFRYIGGVVLGGVSPGGVSLGGVSPGGISPGGVSPSFKETSVPSLSLPYFTCDPSANVIVTVRAYFSSGVKSFQAFSY